MRRIALAILASAFTFALAAPALADGWTGWKTFASHNGVVLEWRTYSHPEHDTKADWRVTNNTTKVLYELWLGQRTYSCENGYTESFVSSAFGGIEGKELNPGLSAIFSTDNETLDYLGADNIDHASCPSVTHVEFDKGEGHALWLSVEPLEQEKPWMEHTFAAREVLTVGCFDYGVVCLEFTIKSERAYNAIRDVCLETGSAEFLVDASCPRSGFHLCDISNSDHLYDFYALDRSEVHRVVEYSHPVLLEQMDWLTPIEYCEETLEGTYKGLQ